MNFASDRPGAERVVADLKAAGGLVGHGLHGRGFFNANPLHAYSINSVTGTKGWNYMVRLYRSRQKILNGSLFGGYRIGAATGNDQVCSFFCPKRTRWSTMMANIRATIGS